MQSGASAGTMRLGDYFTLLRRHWVAVLLSLLLGIVGAVAYTYLAPKEYRATASVLVTEVEQNNNGGNPANAINLDTEAQLVTATETVALAAKDLGVPADQARGLSDRVGVSVPPNTEILDIAYTGDTAAQAQQGALAFAKAYLAQRQAAAQAVIDSEIRSLDDRTKAFTDQLGAVSKTAAAQPAGSAERARSDQQIQALGQQLASIASSKTRLQSTPLSPGQIVTQPQAPSAPSSPNPVVALLAGVVLGLLLGVGLAALRHRADDVIRTPDDLTRRTRVPVAGVLATPLQPGEVAVLPALSADGRGYARLRNLVTTSLEESSRRVVIVAGVRRGGGSVAANLAASLARSGEEVVLLCADVFGSTTNALLGDAPGAGMAEVLADELSVESVARRLSAVPTLRVIGPGRDPDRADALLQTRSPRKLLDQLLQTASYVVIEAPPTTDSPVAQTLANVAELAVLVVAAGETTAREVLDACAQLESVHTAVLGAVIARYGRAGDREPRAAAAGTGREVAADEHVEPVAATRPVPEAGNGAAGNGAAGQGVGGDATGVRPGSVGVDEPAGPQLVPPGSRGPLTR